MALLQSPPDQAPISLLPQANSASPEKKIVKLIGVLKTYPVPAITLVLLFVSFILWLTRHQQLAQGPLFIIVVGGSVKILWDLIVQLRRREFGVDFIAALAILGSLILGEYLAGAIIVLMLSGGEALEAFALQRARSSLAALADRAPRFAHIREGQQIHDISADAVEVGMRVVIKPGELIPVDGVVVDGASSVSEADLTGEPVPVRKSAGSQILSGSVNLDGVLDVQTTRRAAESHYAQIVQLMESAQEQKAPIHRLADRYSVWLTVITLSLSGLAWILSHDSVNALAVLVVATPCPLILATPIAIMSGINAAAKLGVIIKNGGAIEELGQVEVAVFDKTGTLTMGIPQLKSITLVDDSRFNEQDALRFAASIEQFSSHILAHAVVEAVQTRQLSLFPTAEVTEIFGKGVQGVVMFTSQEPLHVAVGNRTFMHHLGRDIPQNLLALREQNVANGEIGSFLAVENLVVGLLILADLPRPELTQLTAELKQAGVKQTVLLTGDSEVVAQRVGRLARMDRVVAKCLPEDKVRTVTEYISAKKHVLMVGDGVNDAPVLATASVGIAVGTQGLSAASNAADAVLLQPDMLRVAQVVRLGRWVMTVARQGIWVGLGLSGIAMIFAALGHITPAFGALLQEGIDVIVIFNALRAGNPPSKRN